MACLDILAYPDPRLRIPAQPVHAFDRELGQLVDDMFDTLYASRGIGLAAPQVNVARKVITIDVSGREAAPEVFINPVILADDAPGLVEESCLSVPGVLGNVLRATRLKVRAHARDGSLFERDLEGLLAVCLQHEIDHLRGRLFVDRLSLVRRLQIYLKFRN